MSYQPGRRGPFRPWLAVLVVLIMLITAILGRSDTASSANHLVTTKLAAP